MSFFSWVRRKKCNPIPQPPVSMNIQEFIETSIVEIMSGIQSAQKKYSEGNSAFAPIICPAWKPPTSDLSGGLAGFSDKIYELEFDLAITVAEASSANCSGTAKTRFIGVCSGELGYEAESSGTQSTISRVRFKIPIRYPLDKLSKPDWGAKA